MNTIRVNIGSGFNGLAGWVNLDNSVVARISKVKGAIKILVRLGLLPGEYANRAWPEIRIHDCRKGLPFEDNEIDAIYSSHFFEHVYRHEALFILQECFRTLKAGGTIRVALPDVGKIATAYVNGELETLKTRGLNDDIVPFGPCDFFVMQFFPVEMNGSKTPGFIKRVQEVALARHKWMYDAETFAALIGHAGFKDIAEMTHGQSKIEDAKLLDCKPETSFYLEAEKH